VYLILTYIRPYELYPGLAPYRLMLVVGAIAGVLSLAYLPLSRFSGRSMPFWLTMFFSMFVLVSPVLALHWFGGALTVLTEFGITITIFVVAVININSLRRFRIVGTFLSWLSIVLVLQVELAFRYGIFASVFILEQSALDGVRLRARATGFMTDPNDLGQSLVMAIPFLALAWRKHALFRNTLLVTLPVVVLCYGIYLTGSRGTILSLGVIVVLMVRTKVGPIASKVVTIFGVLFGMAFLISGGGFFGLHDLSAIKRIEAWSVGLQLLKQHPLVGVGYKQFWNYNEIVAHNAFVTCFSELGLVAFFVWMSLLVATFMELNAIQDMPVTGPQVETIKRYGRSVQLSLYGFLAAAWFLSRTYVVTLYILVAMAIALGEISRREKLPLPPIRMSSLVPQTFAWSVGIIVLLYLSIRFTIR
jgi:hypothetical protein